MYTNTLPRPRFAIRDVTGDHARAALQQMLTVDVAGMDDATAVGLLAAVGPAWAEPPTAARRDHLDRFAAAVAAMQHTGDPR